MIILGNGNNGKTLFYSIDKEEYKSGPSIIDSHTTYSCGLLKDGTDPSIQYIVAGFEWKRFSLETLTTFGKAVAILQVGEDNWASGPNVPNDSILGSYMSTSPDGKSVILSGGNSYGQRKKTLYRFQCPNGIPSCNWEKLPIEMETARYFHTAIFVPDLEFPCKNTN